MGQKIIYLRKASTALVGNCKCDDGRITYPPQQDCPWCGCGWLFTCLSCRQAFTFAKGVELDATWEELAETDWKVWGLPKISKRDISSWVTDMKRLLRDVKPGEEYVCIDGCVFPKNARNVEFDGIYASHKFARLPQVEALDKPSVEKEILTSTEYWRSHRIKKGKKNKAA